MTLYLVRHADAQSRQVWGGDDRGRPLTGKGIDQAAGLLARYGTRPLTRVLSSPAVRCQQTVSPIAQQRGLDVQVAAPLDEGSPADECIALLRSLAGTEAMLCSHGDVIPAAVRALLDAGVPLDRSVASVSKAGTFEIDTDGTDLVAMRYLAPPEVSRG